MIYVQFDALNGWADNKSNFIIMKKEYGERVENIFLIF